MKTFNRFRPLSGNKGNQPGYKTEIGRVTEDRFPSPLGE